MRQGLRQTCVHRRRSRADRRDSGTSIIEILIATVLLGTVVVATLMSLTTSISASALDRDHANAHAWLQTGADMLYARHSEICTSDAHLATIRADYEALVQATQNPEGWSPGNMRVTNLEVYVLDIDTTTGIGTESWSTTCVPGKQTGLQRVTLEVRGEDGRIVEDVTVIIDD